MRGVVWVLALVLATLLTGCASADNGSGVTPGESSAEYSVTVDATPSSTTVPASGGDVDVTFLVTNTGAKADTYTLEYADSHGLLAMLSGLDLPASLTLEPGEAEEVVVPLSFEVGGTFSGTLDVQLTVTSQGDPEVVEQAVYGISFESE